MDEYKRVHIHTHIRKLLTHPLSHTLFPPKQNRSHFETTAADVLSLYKRITGKDLDLTISADSTNPDDY